MGSKKKFWYRANDEEPEWLFKFPQANTGQHWAEKIAAEVSASLEIRHARVELAVFEGTQGSATESFAAGGRNLFHGNQLLAGKVLGYDPKKLFKQSDHTFENIFIAIERTFNMRDREPGAKQQMAELIVLDALIGNTDRHHENWGILRWRMDKGWQAFLAPSFDHASSLGRELVDESKGKCRSRLLREGHVGDYVENALGAGGFGYEVPCAGDLCFRSRRTP